MYDLKNNPEAWAHRFDRRFISQVMQDARFHRKEEINQWLGVRMMQHPSDLMIYQQLITELRPDYIIETGTAYGGLTLYLATLMEDLELPGKVISIDIQDDWWQESLRTVKINERLLNRIQFIKNSSTAPELHKQISEIVKNKKTLIILDSLHAREHVLRELQLYSQYTPLGGYILVNDTNLGGDVLDPKRMHAGLEKLGPLYGVRDFLKENDHFVMDHDREKFVHSCMYSGILKRVK